MRLCRHWTVGLSACQLRELGAELAALGAEMLSRADEFDGADGDQPRVIDASEG